MFLKSDFEDPQMGFSANRLHWCPTSKCNSWSQTLGVWALCPDNPLVIAVVSGFCRWQQRLGRASVDHGRFIITDLSTAPRIMRDWLVSGFQQGLSKYFSRRVKHRTVRRSIDVMLGEIKIKSAHPGSTQACHVAQQRGYRALWARPAGTNARLHSSRTINKASVSPSYRHDLSSSATVSECAVRVCACAGPTHQRGHRDTVAFFCIASLWKGLTSGQCFC